MLAAFQVGTREIHTVEVFSSFLLGKEVVKVDGEAVISKRKFPLWFTDHMQFQVGDEEKHWVELKYNTLSLSSKAYVDRTLHVGCLFPQVVGYNALGVAIVALIIAIIAMMK